MDIIQALWKWDKLKPEERTFLSEEAREQADRYHMAEETDHILKNIRNLL